MELKSGQCSSTEGAVGSGTRGCAGDLGKVSSKALKLGQLRYWLRSACQQQRYRVVEKFKKYVEKNLEKTFQVLT